MSAADLGKDAQAQDRQQAIRVASRLITGRPVGRAESDTPARAAASACDRLYREMSRWVGPDGCHALFTRALAQALPENPALAQIKLRARSEPYIDGVAESIMAHGDAATAEALESMLARLVELLGRLIGDDMAMKLIERSLATYNPADTASGRREEA